MELRRAKTSDFKELYRLGESTPELRVSDEKFMTKEDFKFAIGNKDGILVVAEDKGKIVGFAYSVIEAPTYAAMVYSVVIPEYRGKGIAKSLLNECEGFLKTRNIKSVYGLATNSNVIGMLEHLGYKKGKTLVWMDKNLDSKKQSKTNE